MEVRWAHENPGQVPVYLACVLDILSDQAESKVQTWGTKYILLEFNTPSQIKYLTYFCGDDDLPNTLLDVACSQSSDIQNIFGYDDSLLSQSNYFGNSKEESEKAFDLCPWFSEYFTGRFLTWIAKLATTVFHVPQSTPLGVDLQ